MKARALALPLAGLLLVSAPSASAQTPPGPPAQENKVAAQVLFDDAMKLRKKGQHEDACVKLAESQRLDPAPGTKFYLAECLEQTGKLASAWTLYTEVADEMATTGQRKREAFARERSAALSGKLSRVTILVPDSARATGLVVRRGPVVVGEAQWGVAVPVDPGKHIVQATAPGMVPFTKTVEVTEPGSTVTIVLPRWMPAAAGAATTAIPIATGPRATSAPPPPASPLRTASFALGGVGLAGLVVGAALGGVALAKKDESNSGPCDPVRDVCSAQGLSLRAEAITAATGSTVTFIVSGVVLAASATLFVLPMTGAVRTAIIVGPEKLGLEGRW